VGILFSAMCESLWDLKKRQNKAKYIVFSILLNPKKTIYIQGQNKNCYLQFKNTKDTLPQKQFFTSKTILYSKLLTNNTFFTTTTDFRTTTLMFQSTAILFYSLYFMNIKRVTHSLSNPLIILSWLLSFKSIYKLLH
jgi:hypothetical protein